MKRNIHKVAVIGSGIMGSRIACHFANIGTEVLLLDIVPRELLPEEKAKGLDLNHKKVRTRIVNDALKTAIKSNPSPIYDKAFASRITTGTIEDDLHKIADSDWIIEVVVENLEVKHKVFEQVEKYRKEGSIVSSNTSGIPIHMMASGRSDDFKKHFCGTHFFNPPRYLELLEIIPTKYTENNLLDFLMDYGSKKLGKTTVLCKDTPAFIANRIGVASIMSLFHIVEDMKLTVEEVDRLTGPIMGRPKSATFRTCDLVGLDTLVKVANGVEQHCPNDESRDRFKIPAYIQKMVENKWFGDKTKQGFYKKSKNKEGKREILALNFDDFSYQAKQKVSFSSLSAAKAIEKLEDRLRSLIQAKDKAGDFYRRSFTEMFSYASYRIPEIADQSYQIDNAMRAGFGWELGPFELWDVLGVDKMLELMKAQNKTCAPWVNEMLDKGFRSFYRIHNNKKQYYNLNSKSYEDVPGQDSFIILKHMSEEKTVWKNSGTRLTDIGDGILNLEFQTKMNTIGGEVLEGVNKAIEIAENDFQGLIIANQGANFTVGANLGLVFMMALEQEYDELDFAVRAFQNTSMNIRYSSIPVVVAPHQMTLGGGTELSLHADAIQASAETYMGLVEMGVGLIPGGAGSKEMALRASDSYFNGSIELPQLKERFLNIAMAKVSTSAHEAYHLGYLDKGKDQISLNKHQLIADAKKKALVLAEMGYQKPVKRKDIKVLGKQALGMFLVGADTMYHSGYITEHEKKMSEKLAYVMAGGDLSYPTNVSEQYLLDLEREAFLSLCGERKTLERIQHMLKTGKPLRN
jgi:3-hydroxyacyl-CoA dehydrogenase